MSSKDCPILGIGKTVAKKLTRSEEKRLLIIKAAKTVFLEKSFDIASMDLIAAEAGVSKRTIYSHFKSKELLFGSIMQDMCEGNREGIFSGEQPDECFLFDHDLPVEEALTKLGKSFLRYIYNAESISLMRIVVGQAGNFPEIGKSFFSEGPTLLLSALTEYFEGTNKKGQTDIESPKLAAEIYMATMLAPRHIQCLVNARDLPDEAEIDQHVEQAVKFFCKSICP